MKWGKYNLTGEAEYNANHFTHYRSLIISLFTQYAAYDQRPVRFHVHLLCPQEFRKVQNFRNIIFWSILNKTMWGWIESDLYRFGMYSKDGKVDGSFGFYRLGLAVGHATCFEIKMTHLTYFSIIEPGLTKSLFKITAP